jgi:hypothetical protein
MFQLILRQPSTAVRSAFVSSSLSSYIVGKITHKARVLATMFCHGPPHLYS